ncbi:hypothetical protein C2S53_009242 [Perilla frutescens var. hirtella]|uniref:Uncharacterized protein n=1 Tax=Perilla frutescens var. hirtella TaxID=608512 RepID=A0AAD4NYD7_PERFH|nr:hypothetical protein C2S53_009242 [Perilla frutescens var. hirtella]
MKSQLYCVRQMQWYEIHQFAKTSTDYFFGNPQFIRNEMLDVVDVEHSIEIEIDAIWKHVGILQPRKENKDSTKCEDMENLTRVRSLTTISYMEHMLSYYASINLYSITKKLGNPQRKNDDEFLHEDWWRDLLIENISKEPDQGGKMVLLLDILTMCSNMGDKTPVFSLLTVDQIEYYPSKLSCPRKNGKYYKR